MLTSRELKVKGKEDNIAGIQLVDLFVHPAKIEIQIARSRISPRPPSFGTSLAEVFISKYDLIVEKLFD